MCTLDPKESRLPVPIKNQSRECSFLLVLSLKQSGGRDLREKELERDEDDRQLLSLVDTRQQ